MSVGNASQGINFDRYDLTLVLGENLDLEGNDNRNGTGKTSILNALSYALYGQALTNIKKDNLINKTNNKHMLVTVDFEHNGRNFRIERGRKPNVLKFFIDNEERQSKDDNSQGDSRETQAEIERTIGMSYDMFRHILALNTYTEPFLNMRSNDQRLFIEQLLGITLLSEKAEKLKELSKATKDLVTKEEFRIKAVTDANQRIKEQIDSLIKRRDLWLKKHREEIDDLQLAYDELSKIDIESELVAHQDLTNFYKKKKEIEELESQIKRSKSDKAREEKDITRLKKEIEDLERHVCHTCGQAFHDEKHESVLSEKQQSLAESENQREKFANEIEKRQKKLAELGELGTPPRVFYDHESDAFEHRSSMASMLTQLATKQAETDPYTEQIEDMNTRAIENIDYAIINELNRIKEHQEFLYKLLTNKDSFIRKRIIDQNLTYLNSRLSYYLDRIGLPHSVKFNNDLSVSISELGRDLDPGNLSRGETTRLVLSLSLAFRDVYEHLFTSINLLFIDELMDSGLDANGVENGLSILKKISRDQKKSVWLVSHKDELMGRVENILRVVKSGGFTEYNTDVETV